MFFSAAFWRGLIVGVTMGALLGLLLAPRRGPAMQETIRVHLSKARSEAFEARTRAEKEVWQRYEAIGRSHPADEQPAEQRPS